MLILQRFLYAFALTWLILTKLKAVKVAATDIWVFGIYSESLIEATVQNLRLLFLEETDLKRFLRYYDKLRQWNKLSLNIIVRHFIIIIIEIIVFKLPELLRSCSEWFVNIFQLSQLMIKLVFWKENKKRN